MGCDAILHLLLFRFRVLTSSFAWSPSSAGRRCLSAPLPSSSGPHPSGLSWGRPANDASSRRAGGHTSVRRSTTAAYRTSARSSWYEDKGKRHSEGTAALWMDGSDVQEPIRSHWGYSYLNTSKTKQVVIGFRRSSTLPPPPTGDHPGFGH